MAIRKIIATSAVLLTLTNSVYAMGPGKGGPCGGPPPGPPNVEQLTKQLDLSAVQAESLKQLFEAQKDRHREQGRERRKMHDQMHEAIANILTPSQLEDFMAMNRSGCRKQ